MDPMQSSPFIPMDLELESLGFNPYADEAMLDRYFSEYMNDGGYNLGLWGYDIIPPPLLPLSPLPPPHPAIEKPPPPPPPRSLLPALPNELLLMLADILSERDLNNLLRTSRHMCALFNGYLYKHEIRNKGNFTLYWACTRAQPEVAHKVARKVLALGVEAEAPCTDSFPYPVFESPLLCAIHHSRIEVVRVLLDHGVNIDAQGDDKKNPLEVAAEKGNVEIVRLLLERKAEVNRSSGRSVSPLHSAVREKHIPVIKLLLEYGADPNALDDNQASPLHLARNKETAEILLEHISDASLNISNRCDQTPLAIAVKARDKEWVKLLLTKGADVNHRNRKGETALFFVGGSSEIHARKQPPDSDVEVAKMLLDFGAYVNQTDSNGSTALFPLCEHGDVDTVKLLLKYGSNPATRNRKGLTPTHVAAEEGWPEILKLLLDNGANVNATNYYRSSPLHRLTSIPKRRLRSGAERYCEALRVLLEANANPNSQDRIGQTPLMKSAYHGYWQFVKQLMKDSRVDLTIKDRRNKKAADLAKDEGEESRELAKITMLRVAERDAAVMKEMGIGMRMV